MVRLLDLETIVNGAEVFDDELSAAGERSNPNINQFSAALSCYPIAYQLATYLDLNSLYELSRTCRQVRANLLQYRQMLIARTLHCSNEEPWSKQRRDELLQAEPDTWTTHGGGGARIERITSGRNGICARDMVGDCRRCGRVVCRNCIIKTPTTTVVRGRHRRLCRTCMKAPLNALTSTKTTKVGTGSSDDEENTSLSYIRQPCTCETIVWICQPCGHALRPADTTYIRGWAWRTRYSACGGFGAGLGEGNEGVECGWMSDCLAARMVEKDVECDASELAALEEELAKAEMQGHRWVGCSYSTQEIVGIGGKVKKKVRKIVPVGAIVKEYEDERVTEKFLGREHVGTNRSWCSWCTRVIASNNDKDNAKSSSPVHSTLSDGSEDGPSH